MRASSKEQGGRPAMWDLPLTAARVSEGRRRRPRGQLGCDAGSRDRSTGWANAQSCQRRCRNGPDRRNGIDPLPSTKHLAIHIEGSEDALMLDLESGGFEPPGPLQDGRNGTSACWLGVPDGRFARVLHPPAGVLKPSSRLGRTRSSKVVYPGHPGGRFSNGVRK